MAILKVIGEVLVGLGGTSGLILLIVKWASGLITEGIRKEYDIKLKEKFESYKAEIDKELEKYRSALGNKNYITQKKFDVEFEMYQALANSYYSLVKEAVSLIPPGFTMEPANKALRDEAYDRIYHDLCKEITRSQDLIYRYAPFIRQDIYEGYHQLLNLCTQNKYAYARRWNAGDLRSQEDKESFIDKDYQRSDEIGKKYDAVNQLIREYLQSLEILN